MAMTHFACEAPCRQLRCAQTTYPPSQLTRQHQEMARKPLHALCDTAPAATVQYQIPARGQAFFGAMFAGNAQCLQDSTTGFAGMRTSKAGLAPGSGSHHSGPYTNNDKLSDVCAHMLLYVRWTAPRAIHTALLTAMPHDMHRVAQSLRKYGKQDPHERSTGQENLIMPHMSTTPDEIAEAWQEWRI